MTFDELLIEEIDAYDLLTAEEKERVKANLPAVHDRILQDIKEMSELYSRVRVVRVGSPFESREGARYIDADKAKEMSNEERR